MNTLAQIAAGIAIISGIEPNTSLRAEHDEIWCGEDLDKYPAEAKAELEKLAWNEDDGCGWHRYV
jgi:hypothetical protein